jgi:hypothetical protein
VNYVFEPTNNDLLVHLRVTLNSPAFTSGDSAVHVYYSYSLLSDLNVNYIFLNRYRDTEHQRFSADTNHFSLVFQNGKVEIFRVLNQTVV